MSDKELMMAYRAGDRKSFEVLDERYRDKLFFYLWQYLGNEEAAKDVCQQTFLQIHLKCDQFDDARKFSSWLYAIATHQAVDWQRKNRRHSTTSLDDDEDDVRYKNRMPPDFLEGRELPPDVGLEIDERRKIVRRAVRGAMKKIPKPMAEAIRLVHLKDMKCREAAEHARINISTIKMRVQAGLRKLESLLDKLKDTY